MSRPILGRRETAALLLRLCDTVERHEAEFCRLDSEVGDGDHGVTMSRGFGSVRDRLEDGMSVSECFAAAGRALGASMGGAIGPIYATLFTAFAAECEGAEQIDTARLSAMFARALDDIKLVADVREGQKTLVDALSPAARSLGESADAGLSLEEALDRAAAAAESGAENTRDMLARRGRAKFLKEKSLGYRDAGASSMAVIVGAMARFVREEPYEKAAQ